MVPRKTRISCAHVPSSPSPEDLGKLVKELEDARAQIRELESECQDLRNLTEAAEIHCYFANKVLRDMQPKLNERSTTQSKGAKKLNAMSHILTSEEGQADLCPLEAEEEEWQRRLEVMQKKEKEGLERQPKQGQQDNSAVFCDMRLDEQGTVVAPIERIQTFPQANPAIRYSPYAVFRLCGTKRTTSGHSDDNANPLPGSSQHKRARTLASSTSDIHTALSLPAIPTIAAHPVLSRMKPRLPRHN
ncbi:hypothetical protein M378DRAFT_677667 [Amanita muscaria Koide BX008]|uniref:Uncharacterized protein n=1 Tax=Amanita muscaria (strain Koide BX008) TaxID=946122 RepID=A0A0C2X2J7_AMAMK|nr:hypothetical protein M378DRAFT_677667 [Amanita muscaria Koide BX008]